MPVLEVLTLFFAAIAMALALAHALELPGKLRLDKETYIAVQSIYYPGFTFAGVGEVLAVLAALVLLLVTPIDTTAFPLTLLGFGTLAAMHGAYWVLVHPVNRFWLKDRELSALGAGFFGFGGTRRQEGHDVRQEDLWKRYRNRWEYAHVLRAGLSVVALIALTAAVAV